MTCDETGRNVSKNFDAFRRTTRAPTKRELGTHSGSIKEIAWNRPVSGIQVSPDRFAHYRPDDVRTKETRASGRVSLNKGSNFATGRHEDPRVVPHLVEFSQKAWESGA
jgi:hypothetical protein